MVRYVLFMITPHDFIQAAQTDALSGQNNKGTLHISGTYYQFIIVEWFVILQPVKTDSAVVR